MFRAAATIFVCLVAFMVGAGAAPAGREGKATKPYVQWRGAASARTEGGFVRVTTQEQWTALWGEHSGRAPQAAGNPPPAPEVDFDQCLVIAYFRANAARTTGERAKEIEDQDQRVVLRFESVRYQVMRAQDAPPERTGTSYGIWVIPRTAKPIVIEENVQSIIGQPPIWKERQVFPAI